MIFDSVAPHSRILFAVETILPRLDYAWSNEVMEKRTYSGSSWRRSEILAHGCKSGNLPNRANKLDGNKSLATSKMNGAR